MTDLIASDRAPYLLHAPDVEIPDDVSLGAHVILYSGTRLGQGCRIGDGAIIGRISQVNAGSNAPPIVRHPTVLGQRTIVGAYAIICTDVTIGSDAFIGDRALVREGVTIGDQACVGFSTVIGSGCRVGDRTRLQGFCGIAGPTIIEDDCLIGPHVVALASTFRQSDGHVIRPVRIRRGSRIGSAVQLMPGIEVGSGAMIDAASLVTRDVPPSAHVRGAPARMVAGRNRDPV